MTGSGLHWPHIARALGAAPAETMLDELDAALGDTAELLTLYIADYRRVALTPLGTPSPAPTQPAATDDLAHAALESGQPAGDDDLVAVPVSHHGDPVGVLVLRLGEPDGDAVATLATDVAPLLGAVLSTHFGVSDRLEGLRCAQDMSLAAEVQWSLLPPTTHRADDVVISAALEPAYDTGGDVFDYSRDGPTLRLAVLDAMGHGFQAAVLSVTVTAALRLGRREGADLPELAGRMAAAVGAWAPETSFVTAVLVDLDLRNGDVKWLTAGHIPPLRVGPDGSTPLPHTPGLPLGVVLGDDAPALAVHDGRLEQGESLVLYSDGVVDNLMLAGLSSIDDRESAMRGSVERHIADPPTPGVARRIVAEMLDRTGPDLRDDATLMVVHPTATG